jgi:diadenylate cyclase
MREFFTDLISGFGVWDVIDIAIIALVIYGILGFIRKTRAQQLVKGLMVLVIATFVSEILRLHTVNWILRGTMQFGVIALIIVFQPELRRGLEYVGRNRFFVPSFAGMDKERVKRTTSSIVSAVDHFSTHKTGALIIMEREVSLNDVAETGIALDSEISTELLENIFYEKAPLHDGASIVRAGKVFAAACVLPLSQNKDLASDLGTRHRAGLGITEVSDAVAIIVSEETGIISTAQEGRLTRFLDIKTLEKLILNMYLADQDDQSNRIIGFFKRFRRAHVSE